MAVEEFIERQLLVTNRRTFAGAVIIFSVGYFAVSYWLNSIRATAPLWLVWCGIFAQLGLYIAIFAKSYKRAVAAGMNRSIALVTFVAAAVLGRVNDWDLAIIPLVVVVMLVVSAKIKIVPKEVLSQFTSPTQGTSAPP